MKISFKCASRTDIFTKHVMSCSHNMYELTFMSGGGKDGGGVTCKKASKPVTAVQD